MRDRLVRFGFRVLVAIGITVSVSSGAVFSYLPFNTLTAAIGAAVYLGGFGLFMLGVYRG